MDPSVWVVYKCNSAMDGYIQSAELYTIAVTPTCCIVPSCLPDVYDYHWFVHTTQTAESPFHSIILLVTQYPNEKMLASEQWKPLCKRYFQLWKKTLVCWVKFHRSWYLWGQLIRSQFWSRKYLGAEHDESRIFCDQMALLKWPTRYHGTYTVSNIPPHPSSSSILKGLQWEAIDLVHPRVLYSWLFIGTSRIVSLGIKQKVYINSTHVYQLSGTFFQTYSSKTIVYRIYPVNWFCFQWNFARLTINAY